MNKEIHRNLSESSLEYLRMGLEEFHTKRLLSGANFQAVLGTICTSIELMLKTLIAKKCLKYLFTNLPLDVEIKLTYKEAIKESLTNAEEKDLEYFKFKTIEIDKSISIFYSIYPKEKHDFKPYLNLFSSIRNIAIHGALPSFQFYDLERIAYIALKMFHLFNDQKDRIFSWTVYKPSKKDEEFLKEFDSERAERVKKAIERAKNKSNEIDYWSSFDLDGWEYYVTRYPVCDCDGTLTGTTELDIEGPENSPDYFLSFVADTFKCDECGLELLDWRELKLANMEISYDRNDDLERWSYEH